MRAGRQLVTIAAAAVAVLLAAAVPSSGQLPLPADTQATTVTTVTSPTTTTPVSTTPETSTTTTPATTTPATTTPTTTTPGTPVGRPAAQQGLGLDLDTLAIGITTPIGALAPFAPGRTATSSGLLAITSLGSWTLKVSDGGGNGHLQRSSACATGASELAQPLSVSAAPLIGTSTGAASLGPSATTVASGSATTTITTNVSQPIGSAEVLAAGCAYSATITFTLS